MNKVRWPSVIALLSLADVGCRPSEMSQCRRLNTTISEQYAYVVGLHRGDGAARSLDGIAAQPTQEAIHDVLARLSLEANDSQSKEIRIAIEDFRRSVLGEAPKTFSA